MRAKRGGGVLVYLDAEFLDYFFLLRIEGVVVSSRDLFHCFFPFVEMVKEESRRRRNEMVYIITVSTNSFILFMFNRSFPIMRLRSGGGSR